MSQTPPTFERQPPAGLLRLFLKAPPYLYRGLLAELLRWRCVMLLTTVGRRTGLPRRFSVSFMPLDGRYVAFSGWGVRSNWYRNILVHPEVTLQVGRRRFLAEARPVADPERRRELMLVMQARSARCGPPRILRPLLRLTRAFDYDREITLAVEQGGNLPVVEFIPYDQRVAP